MLRPKVQRQSKGNREKMLLPQASDKRTPVPPFSPLKVQMTMAQWLLLLSLVNKGKQCNGWYIQRSSSTTQVNLKSINGFNLYENAISSCQCCLPATTAFIRVDKVMITLNIGIRTFLSQLLQDLKHLQILKDKN